MSIGTGPGAVETNPPPAEPKQPSKKWKLSLAALIGVYLFLAAYALITNGGGSGTTVSAAATSPRASSPAPGFAPASVPPSTARRAVAGASSGTKPTSSAPVPRAGSPAPHPLGVSSIAAVGPAGPSDGDNPQIAVRLLDVDTDQPWYSQWYATPSFGGLRSGTGLLLDLGEAATVTDVRLTLGSETGADVQVEAGSTPSVDLPAVASAWDAGGTVRLTAATPVKARYLLIWFTRLPPDGHGHYQVIAYDVSVDGTSG